MVKMLFIPRLHNARALVCPAEKLLGFSLDVRKDDEVPELGVWHSGSFLLCSHRESDRIVVVTV